MRFGVGVGVALVVCGSAGMAVAAEATTKKSAAEGIKVASAGGVKAPQAKPAEKTQVLAALPQPKQTVKRVPVKRKRVHASLVARIDLNSQRMHVTSNGKTVGSWTISSGKFRHETPPGSFRPKWTSKMHYSRKYYNSPMPYSVFFNGGIATHGTSHTGRLGSAASHGCIRLRTANARKFYNLVHRHGYKRTRIIVTGRAKINRSAARSRNRSYRRRNTQKPVALWGNAYGSNKPRRQSLARYDRARIARHRARVRRHRYVYPGDAHH